jgi:chromatin remodeling complex protein RSC6
MIALPEGDDKDLNWQLSKNLKALLGLSAAGVKRLLFAVWGYVKKAPKALPNRLREFRASASRFFNRHRYVDPGIYRPTADSFCT